MFSFTTILLLLSAAVTSVSGIRAQITFNNHCHDTIFIWQSNHDDCNSGQNGICYEQYGKAEPWTIPSQKSTSIDWIANNLGTSIKIQRVWPMGTPNIQLEYTINNGIQQTFWDLSNIDGAGPGLAGTPFAGDNVLVTPKATQSLERFPTCGLIFCKSNETCVDAYQYPEQKATKVCPSQGMGVTVDLCLPDNSPLIPYKPANKQPFRFFA